MKAIAHYYYSTQPKHKRKPIRIEITVESDDDPITLDIHGRFPNQREASLVARNIICRFDSYAEEFGRIVVEDTPPKIETID